MSIIEAPEDDGFAERIRDLEDRVDVISDRDDHGHRLVYGVERLNSETDALKSVLNNIDAQQRRLISVEHRTSAVEEATVGIDDRRRRAVRFVGFAAFSLLLIGSILVYVALLTRLNVSLERQDQIRVSNCQARNAASQVIIDRERILANIEGSPAIRDAHLDSAQKLTALLVDCEQAFDTGGR